MFRAVPFDRIIITRTGPDEYRAIYSDEKHDSVLLRYPAARLLQVIARDLARMELSASPTKGDAIVS